MEKSIPKVREREGNKKNPFRKFGNGKGMKQSIPKVRERESDASILGNDRKREFPLTPVMTMATMRKLEVVWGSCNQNFLLHLVELTETFFQCKKSFLSTSLAENVKLYQRIFLLAPRFAKLHGWKNFPRVRTSSKSLNPCFCIFCVPSPPVDDYEIFD